MDHEEHLRELKARREAEELHRRRPRWRKDRLRRGLQAGLRCVRGDIIDERTEWRWARATRLVALSLRREAQSLPPEPLADGYFAREAHELLRAAADETTESLAEDLHELVEAAGRAGLGWGRPAYPDSPGYLFHGLWCDLAPKLGFRVADGFCVCLLYTSPSPRDGLLSRMPSSA